MYNLGFSSCSSKVKHLPLFNCADAHFFLQTPLQVNSWLSGQIRLKEPEGMIESATLNAGARTRVSWASVLNMSDSKFKKKSHKCLLMILYRFQTMHRVLVTLDDLYHPQTLSKYSLFDIEKEYWTFIDTCTLQEKDFYGMARQRDWAGKDAQCIRVRVEMAMH